MELTSRILVTGARGMVGSALSKMLTGQGYPNVIAIDRCDCDLIDTKAVDSFFKKAQAEYVFHIAAKVGGINANNTQSGRFTYENLMMQCNVIEAARICKVKKLIFCGSACIYPKQSPQPIEEESLLTSALEETNIGYAVAKIAGVTMCKMYRKQYGCNFISVMPTNLYGPGDNFNLLDSHVLPAMLRKFHEAKINNADNVELWGTGAVNREFLYVDDLADALIFLMNNYDDSMHINIGTGWGTPIKGLAELIKKIVGYAGEVLWNTKYPDGVSERRLDVSKINEQGWMSRILLEDGIKRTYKWLVDNYESMRK